MTTSHPGDFIRTEMVEDSGLDLVKVAETMGVRLTTLSDLLNGETALSPEMARRIEQSLGIGMDTLLRMQAWYDAARARARAHEVEVDPDRPG